MVSKPENPHFGGPEPAYFLSGRFYGNGQSTRVNAVSLEQQIMLGSQRNRRVANWLARIRPQ